MIDYNKFLFYFLRISYSKGKWGILDGDTNKESANGTWISLTDFRMKKGRSESEPREVENDTEIKISDSILKVLLINYNSFFYEI